MTVGIAIALYNGARFLEAQLDSLRLQTCPADQVVLCDDGSKDDTVAVVRNYIEKYSLQECWQLHINEENLGYAKNFYKAMSLCNTDLVYMCDQDDLWKADKLEKMNAVMAERQDISLLLCKGGVIDAEGSALHGMLIEESSESGAITPVTPMEVLRTLSWTGMLMCIRKEFLDKWQQMLYPAKAPHDFALALCAADTGVFYTYDYVGAFHRRHENNAAKEEHRIWKMLNLNTKLRDMGMYNQYLEQLISAALPLSEGTLSMLSVRYEKALGREQALRQRRLGQLLRVYRSDRSGLLRPVSLLCDIWLLIFGDYSQL